MYYNHRTAQQRQPTASHVPLLILAENVQLFDLDAGGPSHGALEYVHGLEGGDALVRRGHFGRIGDNFQGGGRQGLVHVVICTPRSVGVGSKMRPARDGSQSWSIHVTRAVNLTINSQHSSNVKPPGRSTRRGSRKSSRVCFAQNSDRYFVATLCVRFDRGRQQLTG